MIGLGLSPLVVSTGVDGKFGIRFREIDRYSLTPPPPSVSNFAGQSTYSTGDAPFSFPPTPPRYGLALITDPWFPRDPTVIGIRMGEKIQGGNPYDLENGVPVSGLAEADNVSNYDGSAVSL
jgi:hypothetical protein